MINSNEAMLVLNKLPNIQILNGRSTKEEDDEEEATGSNNNNHLYVGMEQIEEVKNLESNSNYLSDNNNAVSNNINSTPTNKGKEDLENLTQSSQKNNINVDEEGFKDKFKAHQELSRTASAGQFKGGLSGNNEIETKYHTATHLLNAALKVVVNKDVHQKGSNITDERMRFDFSCDHKLSDEEKQKTEDLVNEWIKDGLKITVEEMSKEDAIKSGAECMFIEKYPDIVTVYTIGDNISKELCGGPHVKNTNELGHFKIVKEEASSAGVRRIKAILE